MLVLAALAGCTPAGGNANEFIVNGSVSGATAAQSARVAVLWRVNATAPYQYKFGDGTASQYQFVLTLEGDPPAAAINASGLAIGEVVMFSGEIAGGVYTATPTLLAATMDSAVIWKDPLGSGLGTWDVSFGGRYSCAKCVRPVTGLDSYQLTGCAQVNLVVGGAATCHWY